MERSNSLPPFPTSLERVPLKVVATWPSQELGPQVIDVLRQILPQSILVALERLSEKTNLIKVISLTSRLCRVKRDGESIVRIGSLHITDDLCSNVCVVYDIPGLGWDHCGGEDLACQIRLQRYGDFCLEVVLVPELIGVDKK